jgi:hypothetical protein
VSPPTSARSWAGLPPPPYLASACNADAVITADAMRAPRSHATCVAGRGAGYVLTIKRNQPGLFAQLAALPWR